MVYRPETYEERADHAEWKVEELESMIFSYNAEIKIDREAAYRNLTLRWREYLEQTR